MFIMHILLFVLLLKMQGCFAQEQIQNVNIKTVWTVGVLFLVFSLGRACGAHMGRAWQGSSCTVIAFDWKTDYREEL
jgi:hypothetical protein